MKVKKGASIVEAVLIMVMLFGLVKFAFSQINIEKLRPVNYLKGMVQYGVWETGSSVLHPNTFFRTVTIDGCVLDSDSASC